MADCVVQNDGTSLILLNDGTSCILLNGAPVVVAGVNIEGTHATQLIGPRAGQLIPVKFSFWLTAGIMIKTFEKLRFKSILLIESFSHAKLKSSILVEAKQYSLKIKAPGFDKILESTIKLQSLLLANVKLSIVLGARNTSEKMKKFLFKKLKEYLDEDG